MRQQVTLICLSGEFHLRKNIKSYFDLGQKTYHIGITFATKTLDCLIICFRIICLLQLLYLLESCTSSFIFSNASWSASCSLRILSSSSRRAFSAASASNLNLSFSAASCSRRILSASSSWRYLSFSASSALRRSSSSKRAFSAASSSNLKRSFSSSSLR